MRARLRVVHLVAVVAGLASATQAGAFPQNARQMKAACLACHVNPAGGAGLTPAGTEWKASKKAFDASAIVGADYVGATRCKTCHMKEYSSWQTTKHAMAMTALTSAPDSTVAKMAAALKVTLKGPAAQEASCLSCHTTGYMLSGGYPGADSAKTAALAMVSCESCHGPGSKHVAAPRAEKKNMINRAVSAAMCQQCHTAEMSPKFAFEEYKKTGLHEMKPVVPPTAK